MRDLRIVVLVAAGCIGAIVSALLLFPGVYAAVFPFSQAGEGGAPANVSGLAPGPENATGLLVGPVSPDEKLESLIAGASVPLLELFVEQIHAVHAQDDEALRDRAADLSSLAESLHSEAAALEVSPENESARSNFLAALDEFAIAGNLLGGGIPASRSVTDDALGHLALGTERLSEALQDCNRPPAGDPDAATVSAGPGEESDPAYPDALQPGDRFCYEDARKENSASLIAGPVTWTHTFQTTGTKSVRYAAKPGMTYLLVSIRATHLGHRGDGVNIRIQTPAESVFTLYYADETYRPLTPPGATNQGGSYSKVVLDRSETLTGYLFFEVPESLDPARAYLQAKIGTDSPVWVLGKPA